MFNYEQSSPIFIIGVQRSGTTLLRLMLNAHSQIAIPEEGGFWRPLLRRFRTNVNREFCGNEFLRYVDYLREHPQFKLWGIEAKDFFEDIRKEQSLTLAELMSRTYAYYASTFNKPIWGDKTPSFFRMIPTLKKLFPNARFIHIVRDGRDLYLSWRKVDPSKNNITMIALEWVYKVKKAQSALLAIEPERSLQIKYEDLVNSPCETLSKVCNFLFLTFEKNMLNYWLNSYKYIGLHHSELIFQPVSTQSVERWKTVLSRKQVRKFECIAGSTLANNGYELSIKDVRRSEHVLDTILSLLYGIPLRTAQVFITALSEQLDARFGIQLQKPDVGDFPRKTSHKPFE